MRIVRPRNLLRWIAFAAAAVVAGGTGAAGCGLTVTGVVDVNTLEAGLDDGSDITDANDDETQAPLVVCGEPHICVSVPRSWSVVTIVDSRGQSSDLTFAPTKDCAPGWANRAVGIDNPHSSAGTCGCSCGTPVTSPCPIDTSHTLNFRTGGSGSCNDSSTSTNTDGNCHVPGTWPGNTNGAGGAAIQPQTVACGQTTALPSALSDGAFAICSLAASVGACTGGTCLDAPTTPICLARSGVHDCPIGGYTRHVIVPPEKINDRRVCSLCTCSSSTTSCTTSLTAYSMNNCQGASTTQTVTLDGACHTATGTPSSSYRYTVTPDTMACSTLTPNVAILGGIERSGETTLCCPP